MCWGSNEPAGPYRCVREGGVVGPNIKGLQESVSPLQDLQPGPGIQVIGREKLGEVLPVRRRDGYRGCTDLKALKELLQGFHAVGHALCGESQPESAQ